MTSISRTSFEAITRAMVEDWATGPKKINRENQVSLNSLGRRVEATPEQKAFLKKNQAASTASEAHFQAWQREHGIRADAAYYAAETYTKFGKMSSEEREAYVQQKLAQFDEAEAHHAKYQQEIAENNVSATQTGQAAAENLVGSPVANYFRYEESREMYLSNISSLSLNHARMQLNLIELKIQDKEDVGMNVHGRYGDQEISDLNTYLAALKDYISKLEIGGSPASRDATKGTAPIGG